MQAPPFIPEVSDQYRVDIKEGIEKMPAAKLLGLRVIGFDPSGISRIEVPIVPSITFDGKNVQGGILGVIADFAGVSAATCALEPGWVASTTSFEIHNIAPANGNKLIAIGRAVKVGKSIGVSRADVFSETDGKLVLVCIGTTTCKPFQMQA